MKYCLAAILIIMLSLQVVPVKKIGKLLGKVQGTEQVQDDTDSDVSCNNDYSTTDAVIPRHSFNLISCGCYLANKIALIIQVTEALPLINTENIPSPPPEC